MQAITYETLAPLGPFWSALLAGYIVVVFGRTYLTCAGARYLERS